MSSIIARHLLHLLNSRHHQTIVQKKPKRTATKSAKPKTDNPEDRAYIIKLENEINKLKSTIEMQSNLTSHQHQSSAPPLNPTGIENQNFNNVQ